MNKFFIIIFIILYSTLIYGGQISIIVNDKSPLATLSDSEIKDIYLGNMKFINNEKIIPIHMQEGDAKNAFLREVINTTPKEYKIYWIKKIFNEAAAMPETIDKSESIIKIVKKNKNIIGYVENDELKNTEGIKIIKTINYENNNK